MLSFPLPFLRRTKKGSGVHESDHVHSAWILTQAKMPSFTVWSNNLPLSLRHASLKTVTSQCCRLSRNHSSQFDIMKSTLELWFHNRPAGFIRPSTSQEFAPSSELSLSKGFRDRVCWIALSSDACQWARVPWQHVPANRGAPFERVSAFPPSALLCVATRAAEESLNGMEWNFTGVCIS